MTLINICWHKLYTDTNHCDVTMHILMSNLCYFHANCSSGNGLIPDGKVLLLFNILSAFISKYSLTIPFKQSYLYWYNFNIRITSAKIDLNARVMTFWVFSQALSECSFRKWYGFGARWGFTMTSTSIKKVYGFLSVVHKNLFDSQKWIIGSIFF